MAKKRGSKVLKEEVKIERMEAKELKTLESLKKEVEKESLTHPLTRITRADVVRSIIGALIGTVGHFAFFYGAELAGKISLTRATVLYLMSLLVCFFFMYYSGFRKVKEIRIFRFIPMRVAVVYAISILVVLVTLFVFGIVNVKTPPVEMYKVVSTTLLLAVLGASTADILGKE
ncbi:DUF2391 family protein [Candidatus Woesearchaeota archaeon]|nr:DUF2391 family protein [Candidatus Woesearchaeota archaeon]